MAGRRADPDTPNRVYPHSTQQGKYKYAAIQVRQEGKTRPKVTHIGNLEEVEGKVIFTPNTTYRLMPAAERQKLIFPKEWDISKASAVNDTESSSDEQTSGGAVKESESRDSTHAAETSDTAGTLSALKPLYGDNPLDRMADDLFYGSFWLLEEMAVKAGVYDDLMVSFDNDISVVREIMSLAFYPYISGRSYSRFTRWQNTHKTLIDYTLESSAITKLTRKITDTHRMTMIKLRLKRQPEDIFLDCDSTTRYARGTCIVNVCRETENPKLQNTVEAYVYSLTTHEPVYYRSFPGNTAYISAVKTILRELAELGIKKGIIMADSGHPSEEEIASLVQSGIPFLMCAEIEYAPVSQLLLNIKYDEDGLPEEMVYDKKQCLYYTQMDLPKRTSGAANGVDGAESAIKGLKANLFMSPDRRVKELQQVKSRIKSENEILDRAIAEHFIPPDIKKYNALFDYFEVEYTVDDKGKPNGIVYTKCENKITQERSKCGFFGSIMFAVDIGSEDALDCYKIQNEHEMNFDQLTFQLLFDNDRNYSENDRNGRSFLSFIGQIPMSRLWYAWKTTWSDVYESPLDMLDEMEPIRYIRHTDGRVSISPFTSMQVDIAAACGVKPPAKWIPPM